MAGYKVSYKILRQQGDDMKAAAKLVYGYAERVSQIKGKLGDDEMLAEVRANLQKLEAQLGESRTVLSMAGEFLQKTVDSYTNVEIRQVKQVDSTKAHNRDFYKNPVVVASPGGAAASATATTVATAPVTTASAAYTPAAAASVAATPETATSSASTPVSAPSSTINTPTTSAEMEAPTPDIKAGVSAGAAAGAGVLGGAIGAGAAIGAKHLWDEKKKAQDKHRKMEDPDITKDDVSDLDAALEKAIQRVKDLEAE